MQTICANCESVKRILGSQSSAQLSPNAAYLLMMSFQLVGPSPVGFALGGMLCLVHVTEKCAVRRVLLRRPRAGHVPVNPAFLQPGFPVEVRHATLLDRRAQQLRSVVAVCELPLRLQSCWVPFCERHKTPVLTTTCARPCAGHVGRSLVGVHDSRHQRRGRRACALAAGE